MNEFSTCVVEAIDNQIEEQLNLRKQNMSNYTLYGPPDLCYIIKEKIVSSGFKKKVIN